MSVTRYILLLLAIGFVWFVAVQFAMAADAFLLICRPNEECLVKHRHTEMVACTVDLASEKNLNREPAGTRLLCMKVEERKEARNAR